MSKKHSDLDQEGGELNLVPYLDVMVNLVIFMLMNITGFLAFTVLNASVPQISPNVQEARETLEKKKELLLMVRVTNEGFLVEPSVQGGPNLMKTNIPKNGELFNFELLRAQGKNLKAQFPQETKVLIIAQPLIRYEDIIGTMDALRDNEADGDNAMFPDVTLSVL